MSITPLTFTGVSTFSSDFQTVLDRATQIAALPVTALTNDQKTLTSKETAMATLRTSVSDFAATLSALTKIGSGGNLTATSSNTSLVTATAASSATTGTYVISDITSLASSAVATSSSTFADISTTAVDSSDNKLQLVVGSEKTTLDLSSYGNNLGGLRDAINASSMGVTASIVTASSGSYYLSITSDAAGEKNIEVRTTADSSSTNIMEMTNNGSNAVFKLNGKTVTTTENSTSDVVDGLTINLLAKTSGTESATITVAQGASTITTAMQNLTDKYNALVTELDKHVGSAGGALTGDSVISDILSRLRQVTGYQRSTSSTGGVNNLADLGIEMASDGTMSYDSTAVSWMSTSELNNALSFFGNSTSGFGVLSQDLYSLSDPTTGSMKDQISDWKDQYSAMTDQINTITDRITLKEETLKAKLQAADTLLARMASQKSTLTSLINTLNAVTNGTSSSSTSSSSS
jgi:flagellar hook-associated protein 2